MRLSNLFQTYPETLFLHGAEALETANVAFDSRKVCAGDLFFAIPGTHQNGRAFIDDALKNGAQAVVLEGTALTDSNIAQVIVPDIRRALGIAAAAAYHFPARSLCSYAVTGTNGKTSVSWIVAHALARMHGQALYVGTLGNLLLSERDEVLLSEDTNATTPDPVAFHRFLQQGVARGATALAAEVTSHALAQQRILGVEWDCCVFTNLTRDHLDYHKTFEAYGNSKAALFTEHLRTSTKVRRCAVINYDDDFGRELERRLENAGLRLLRYSASGRDGAEFRVVEVRGSSAGTEIVTEILGQRETFRTQLVGSYNVDNSLAAIAALWSQGVTLEQLKDIFSTLPPVPGRLEPVRGDGVTCYVDYAHTPDALAQALKSLRPFVSGRLITVFGCGGDRDRGKRPLMARAVAQGADVAVVTSDNPRTEDPMAIIEDVLPGFADERQLPLFVEADRRQAIKIAIEQARDGDVVLIAGKGHEAYQEIRGVKHPFLDRAVAQEILSQR